MTPMMEDKTKDKMKDKMKDEMKDEKSKTTLVGQMPPRTMMMFPQHLMESMRLEHEFEPDTVLSQEWSEAVAEYHALQVVCQWVGQLHP